MYRSSKHATASRQLQLRDGDLERGVQRRAFTIVELVVAIAVSAIVIVTVSSALSRISRTRDVARTRLEAVTRANAALDAVRRDLVSVVRDGDLFYTRVLIFDGTTYTPYGQMGRDEVLVFNNRLRPMRRDAYTSEGGEYESQYRIEDDRDGSVLWLRRDAVPDENSEGGGRAIPSVEGVVGIEVEAYDGEAWYPDWDSDVFGLPWALRVTITATGESADNPSSEPLRSLITLRTQIPIDRIIPPPPPPEEEDPAANPAGLNADPSGDPNADALGAGGPSSGAGPGGPGGDAVGADGQGGGRGQGGGGGQGGGRGQGGGQGGRPNGGGTGVGTDRGPGGGLQTGGRPAPGNRPSRGAGQGNAVGAINGRGGFSTSSRGR